MAFERNTVANVPSAIKTIVNTLDWQFSNFVDHVSPRKQNLKLLPCTFS